MMSLSHPITSHAARVFVLYALRKVSEEPIRRFINIAEEGGFDGRATTSNFYGQLLLGIKPELIDRSDEEMARELAEFKRWLKVDPLPDHEMDILEVFCEDIRPDETMATNEKLGLLHGWFHLALEEIESQREVGAGWVSPQMIQ